MFLPLSNPRSRPTTAGDVGSTALHQTLATVTAIQLLATCFTASRNEPVRSTHGGPSRGESGSGDEEEPKLISSLRKHADYSRSPAFGHHGRDSSLVSDSPEYPGPSREDILAEEVSLNRRRRALSGGGRSRLRVRPQLFRHASADSIDNLSSRPGHHKPSLWHRACHVSPVKDPLRRRLRDRFFRCPIRAPVVSHIYGMQWPAGFISTESVDPAELTHSPHRRQQSAESTDPESGPSFQLPRRLYSQPFFIQPVKESVIRDWRPIRSLSWSESSHDELEPQHRDHRNNEAASNVSISAAPCDPSTMTTMSTSSASNLEPHSAPAVLEHLPPTRASRLGPILVPPQDEWDTSSGEEDEAVASNFSLQNPQPNHPDQASRLFRTSTSGTTRFSPGIIAEASPNSSRVPNPDSDDSSSGSSLAGPRPGLGFL